MFEVPRVALELAVMREVPLTTYICMLVASAIVSVVLAPISQPAFADTTGKPDLINVAKQKANQHTYNKAPRFVRPHATLSQRDELATLEAIHYALSNTADGETYVWRSTHGRLNAVLQPTTSFLDSRDRVCRHVVIMLNSGLKSKRAEGIACLSDSGTWSLAG